MELSRVVTAVVAHSLAVMENPVTVPQLRVLVLVGSGGPLNVSAVAEALGVNPSNASRTTDQLVGAGLVHRTESGRDRRNVSLTLSPAGRQLIDDMMANRRAVFAAVVAELTENQQTQLTRSARAFTRAAHDLSGRDRLRVDGDRLLGWLV